MEYLHLRTALVDYLEDKGYINQQSVRKAMLEVPRHLYIDAKPGEVYTDQALIIKSAGNQVISTISQPSIVAHMLEELGVTPGNAILEVGTGLGYNAALLGNLTGHEGMVITIEYDKELAARAAKNLADLPNIHAMPGDGRLGCAEHAPYDRIIVTVTSPDVFPAWQQQMSPNGGVILLPLEIRPGVTRLLKLLKQGDQLRGSFGWPVSFVSMAGEKPSENELPEGLLGFIQLQNLPLKKKEALLFFCLLYDGAYPEALTAWKTQGCPNPQDFTVHNGEGLLNLSTPSLKLGLSINKF